MDSFRLPLRDLPAEGREFLFDDPGMLEEPLRERGIEGVTIHSLRAALTVVPQRQGYLVDGRLACELSLPCSRCTEPAVADMDEPFQVFALKEPGEEEKDDNFLRPEGDGYELDVPNLLAEQFVMDMPVKPLCAPGCKGICSTCGANLNTETCSCETGQGDPRLAALRGLNITKRGK